MEKRWFGQTLDRFLDIVYPRNCIHCGGGIGEGTFRFICDLCASNLYRVEAPFCPTCGYPYYGMVEMGRACPHCLDLDPLFEAGRTVLLHRGLGQEIIQNLKYKKAVFLLEDIGRILRSTPWLPDYLTHSILVPVPLHARKLRERGFNQSALLAHGFASLEKSSMVAEILRRRKDTESQTRLSREERKKNIKNAFSLSENPLLKMEKTHIVIDDVFTTGATLNASCRVLRKAGIVHLKVLTLAHG